MISTRKTIVLGIVIATIISGTFILSSNFLKENEETERDIQENQVWWIASDPHLGVESSPLDSLETAIEDVNSLGIADYAIQLGDEIHETTEYRENFFQLMNSLEVENWYYILGNHDYIGGSGSDNILPPVDETIEVMGMKWILISDHVGGFGPNQSGGTMPENLQTWMKEEISFSEKPVFVFSHQPPRQWEVFSEKLEWALSDFRLRAWFYGHIHEWRTRWIDNHMLSFSDCSLDWAHNRKGVFMYLKRKDDKVNVTLRFRNHKEGEWMEIPVKGENVENINFSVSVA